MVAVVRSGISEEDQGDCWPIVFTKKGLRAAYLYKGQPGKDYDKSEKCVRYVRIFGQVSIIGWEGLEIGLLSKNTIVETHSMSITDFGSTAQILNMEYDFEKAAKETDAAHTKSKKRTAKTTPDESEALDEDKNPTGPVTRSNRQASTKASRAADSKRPRKESDDKAAVERENETVAPLRKGKGCREGGQ